jgi:hypothetical protein
MRRAFHFHFLVARRLMERRLEITEELILIIGVFGNQFGEIDMLLHY